MIYSYSTLKTFRQCPKAFKFKSEFMPKFAGKNEGSYLHEVIQAYTLHLKKNGLGTDIDMLLPIAERIQVDGRYPNEFLDSNTYILDKFAHSFVLDPNFHSAELKLSVDREGRPAPWDDCYMRGVVDRIDLEDNRVIITDYKTGWAIVRDRFQLEVYAWLVYSVFPDADTFYCQNHFVREAYLEGEDVSLIDIEAVKNRVHRQVAKIEREEKFEASPGPHCTYCPYLVNCGQMTKIEKVGMPSLLTPKQARQYAQKVMIVEEALKRIKGQLLKPYCQEHGPIELPEGTYAFQAEGGQRFKDIEKFCETLWEAGINPFDYMAVDMRKAKSLLLQFGHLAVEEKSSRFGFKKSAKELEKRVKESNKELVESLEKLGGKNVQI